MKMGESQAWKNLKFFGRHENWGNPDEIDARLVEELEELRYTIGYPILITCGTQGKHVPNSLHYKGLAVDIMFPTCPRQKIPDIFFTAVSLGFNGLGLYSHWKIGDTVHGGMHLDMRDSVKKALWLSEKNGEYLKFSFYDLKRLFA